MVRAVNSKGQALTESLVVGLVLTTGLLFFIRLALVVQQTILIDEFIEQALICLIEKNETCTSNFEKQLRDMNLTEVSITHRVDQGHATLSLTGLSQFGKRIEKESELQLDLQVAK